MATIYNSNLTNELRDGAKIQISKDKIPTELAEKVIPVMEVNPKLLRKTKICRSLIVTNSTSGTIYTTPTTQDFYLTGATISVIKDATATSVYSQLVVYIDGASQGIMNIPGITLTAQNQSLTLSFPIPVKLDRGSTINISNNTNVGNVVCGASIFGFVDETSNA